jgi:HD-like signal output (HDOD) protein
VTAWLKSKDFQKKHYIVTSYRRYLLKVPLFIPYSNRCDMNIDRLLKLPNTLPSAPKVVRKLMETFNQEEVDTSYVASLIEEDPVLTAKLLKTANSAFFGISRSVTNARDALQVMGLIKVRALVIAASLGEGFRCVGGVNHEQFWRYSIASANLSRCIALPIKLDESVAFTAGLVHNIGELMMHAAMPEAMMELNQRVPVLDIKRAQAEQGLFGYSYGEVGAALAKDWLFPQKMIDAIRHQAAPFGDDVHEPIAGVVHIASWRARGEEMSLSGEKLISSYPDPIGMALGINLASVLGETIPSFTQETDDALSG